jgi:phosphinothricin acetyltransferase
LTVRPAEPEDAAVIAAIYNEGIEDRVATFETDLRSAADIEAVLRERAGRYPARVIDRGAGVIGFAWSMPYSSRPCYAGVAEFSVYVARAGRGSGAGREVLQALLDDCDRLGFTKLTSRVFAENAPSRAVCRALGFEEIGVHRRHARLDGEWRDCVVVERLLGDARS